MEIDPKQVEQFIKQASQAEADAAPILEKAASDAAAYRTQAPVIVDKLIALGMLDSVNKQAAINSLQSPDKVMGALHNLLDERLEGPTKVASAPSSLGSPEQAANTEIKPNQKSADTIWQEAFGTK